MVFNKLRHFEDKFCIKKKLLEILKPVSNIFYQVHFLIHCAFVSLIQIMKFEVLHLLDSIR